MAEPPSRQAIVWSTRTRTRLEGGGGQVTRGGGSQEEEGQRASAKGASDAPEEAGSPEQLESGGGPPPPPPPATTEQGYVRAGGGADPSTEKGTYLQGFTTDRAHMLLREVYGDFLHHKDGMHLTGGFPDEAENSGIDSERRRRQLV